MYFFKKFSNSFFFLGGNPSKINLSVFNPDPINAEITELGPGMGLTKISFSLAFCKKLFIESYSSYNSLFFLT